jgi:hypothetical protein
VRDAEAAIRLEFLGSPTVRINGHDVDPAAHDRTDYSFSCRLYGDSGVPPRALIEQALPSARPPGRSQGGKPEAPA